MSLNYTSSLGRETSFSKFSEVFFLGGLVSERDVEWVILVLFSDTWNAGKTVFCIEL